MTITAANVTVTFTGPPAVCEKCKKTCFSVLMWPNRDGTTELTYCCAGCGRVYDPQPIDCMAAWKNMAEAMVEAITSGVQAFSAPLVPKPKDPHRRENWRAMERKHGRRWKGRR